MSYEEIFNIMADGQIGAAYAMENILKDILEINKKPRPNQINILDLLFLDSLEIRGYRLHALFNCCCYGQTIILT